MGSGGIQIKLDGQGLEALGLSGATPLADFIRLAYLPALAQASPRFLASAERRLATLALPHLGRRAISAIDVAAVHEWLEKMTWTAGVKHTDTAAAFAHLGHALGEAARCRLIPANPCAGIEPEPRVFRPGDLGENPTFSQFAKWAYLPACRAIQRVTSSDVSALTSYAIPALGGLPLGQLTAGRLSAFLAPLKAQLGKLDYSKLFYALEGVCSLAIEKGFLAAAAWSGLDGALRVNRVQQTHQTKSRPHVDMVRQYLSKDDASRVMDAFKADAPQRTEARVLLLVMLTGAALGDITRAGWKGFDSEGRTLKAGVSGRVIYLSAQAAGFIERLGRGKGWFFPNPKTQARPCSELAVRRYFEKTMLALGLVGFGINDLRMPYVRFLFERKVPAETVGRLVGLEPSEFSGLMGATL